MPVSLTVSPRTARDGRPGAGGHSHPPFATPVAMARVRPRAWRRGIDGQVEHHLLNLAAMARTVPGSAAAATRSSMAARYWSHQIADAGNDRAEIQHLRPDLLLARENEQLPGQPRSTLRRGLDLLGIVAHPGQPAVSSATKQA